MRYILLLLILCSCYNQKQAIKQFNKAALAYPVLPANYCAKEFPVKEIVKRDTLINTDTVLVKGEEKTDTVMVNGVKTIVLTKTLPGQIITNTIHITDTIRQENTASLKACEINRDNAIVLALTNDKRANGYKSKAQRRGAIMWSLIGLIVLVIAANIYIKANKIKLV